MADAKGPSPQQMSPEDFEISRIMVKIQAAIAGENLEASLNALANHIGTFSVLGAETKGDALANVRTALQSSRKVVENLWGKPEINEMRGRMRGVSVQ